MKLLLAVPLKMLVEIPGICVTHKLLEIGAVTVAVTCVVEYVMGFGLIVTDPPVTNPALRILLPAF